jgi:hypothetical protein
VIWLLPLLDSLFTRADNLQRVLFVVGSCHLDFGFERRLSLRLLEKIANHREELHADLLC